jgi:AcrR family transcriptional regulator
MKLTNHKTRLPKGEARGHILNIAGDLFYRQGIRAVGIDTIVAEAGVAKTTLYDHFSSKDDLITAYLEARDAEFWAAFDATLAAYPDSPRGVLEAAFTAIEGMIAAPESLGCPFLSAAAEFPDLDAPGHAVALRHKQAVRARLGDLAEASGAHAPDALADALMLILDGAFAAKRVYRVADSPAARLGATARLLLDAHLGPA